LLGTHYPEQGRDAADIKSRLCGLVSGELEVFDHIITIYLTIRKGRIISFPRTFAILEAML